MPYRDDYVSLATRLVHFHLIRPCNQGGTITFVNFGSAIRGAAVLLHCRWRWMASQHRHTVMARVAGRGRFYAIGHEDISAMIRIMSTLRREFVLRIEIMDGVTFWEKYWRAITIELRGEERSRQSCSCNQGARQPSAMFLNFLPNAVQVVGLSHCRWRASRMAHISHAGSRDKSSPTLNPSSENKISRPSVRHNAPVVEPPQRWPFKCPW